MVPNPPANPFRLSGDTFHPMAFQPILKWVAWITLRTKRMGRVRRAFWLMTAWFVLSAWFVALPRATGQALYPTHVKLTEDVDLDLADLATKAHLQLIKEAVAGQQWEEAVEGLRKLTEDHGGKVVFYTPRRYVSVRDSCHLQIAELPPDALALYRSRVDPQARRWYESGVANRDTQLLLNVVEQLFCSSWGDDALLALGEIALEQGDFGNARGYWEKILPPWYWARQTPAAAQAEGTATWLVYPDTDLDLAGVKARLVWVMILEGDRELARAGLDAFAREFGEAEGRFAGRKAPYVETLGKLSRRQRLLAAGAHQWRLANVRGFARATRCSRRNRDWCAGVGSEAQRNAPRRYSTDSQTGRRKEERAVELLSFGGRQLGADQRPRRNLGFRRAHRRGGGGQRSGDLSVVGKSRKASRGRNTPWPGELPGSGKVHDDRLRKPAVRPAGRSGDEPRQRPSGAPGGGRQRR